jgi:hypothetical protein
VALATSALLSLPAVPALAAPGIEVSPGSATVQAGSDVTVTVTVNPKEQTDSGPATINLTGLPPGVTCTSGCGQITLAFPKATTQLLTLKAGGGAAATNATVTVQVQGASPATKNFSLTVKAADAQPSTPQTQTVKEISGKVTDSATGKAIPGATVGIQDSGGHTYTTQTNDNGNYRFTGSENQPITPGQVVIAAAKDNINNARTVTAGPGQTLRDQRIVLKLPEPTPSASASASALPTGVPTVDVPTESDAPAAAGSQPAADKAAEESGFGGWWLFIVGGLLVAVGVGAIVLLLMRRKDNDDDSGPSGGAAGGGRAPGPTPGGFDGADRTRVTNPLGADPTMVGGAAMADAPTMMHNRPLVDEFPDPYGAPLPQPQQPAPTQVGGYGMQEQGWGAAPVPHADAPTQIGPPLPPYGGEGPSPNGGYGNSPGSGAGAGYGNAPGSGAGYGNGYGGQQAYGAASVGYPGGGHGGGAGAERYDEPTGRYTGGDNTSYGEPADPYQTGGTYGQPGGQPQPPQQYGQDPGYDQRGAYPAQGAAQVNGYGGDQGYGGAPAGGYGQPYGGQPQQQPPAPGGYDQGGYYGNQPQRPGPQPPAGPQPPNQPGRRSLDWLDD